MGPWGWGWGWGERREGLRNRWSLHRRLAVGNLIRAGEGADKTKAVQARDQEPVNVVIQSQLLLGLHIRPHLSQC